MRADALVKVTGLAQYTVDVDLPGMLHAKTLRSPHPHALVTSIDTSKAAAADGVRAVLTRDDLDELGSSSYGYFIKDQPILALDRVRYIGDEVVAVAADTELQAVRALELVEVTYEPLPALSTIDESMAEGAPELFPDPPLGIAPSYGDGAYGELRPSPNVCYRFGYRTGSADAFDRCDHVFTDRFNFDGRQQHVHLEPFAAVAQWVDGGERLEVWSSCQNPFPVRKELGRLLGIGENKIRLRVPYIGGGFGAKNGCKTEPIAALLSLKAGAPVRYCLTNDENFLTQRQHNTRLVLTTGVMADGTFVARKAEIHLDSGAYADASPLVAEKVGYRVAGPYRWEHIDTVTDAVLTTTTPAGPFRGFGGTQANFACESQLDMIADRLGIDPVELRHKNLLQLGEPYVPGESGMDSDIDAGLDLVANAIGWDEPRPASRGRGVAIGFKDSGGVNKPAQARVKVATSGDVFLQCGTVEIGQGIHTALRRVVADIIGVGPERVHWAELDTDHTPFDQGTNASSGVSVMGQAVEQAARSARSKILEFAAGVLNVLAPELDLRDGQIIVNGEARPLAPLVMGTYGGTGYEFTGEGFFKAAEDHRAPLETQCVSWEYGWGAAEVEVDEETGAVTVHRLIVSGDAGMALHADACRGQDEGAAMMGFGGAMFETMRYDGSTLANGNLVSYRIARANDLPAEFTSILQEQGHGPGPFGSKGMGEGTMLPVASAIANAIFDATGARVTTMPFTPETVLAALDRRQDPQ
ncbi:MAG: CO/xanthine dehydrogenase Mo-binding subunit [Candidatus Poriferisodalaceae bacterium]|jgi:CO/xanthine dehydrogenase Mo-binding subunit